MAKIIITRSKEYANRFRSIKILLDGNELAKIDSGETKEFEIMSGKHTLQAKIDWCTSNELSIICSGNETRSFILDSFAKHNPLGILAAIYYTTFGYQKYLNLSESH